MINEKTYHIYAKKECLYCNLSESEFKVKWNELNGMVGLLHTDYEVTDLSYEELRYTGGAGGGSSGGRGFKEPPGSDSY